VGREFLLNSHGLSFLLLGGTWVDYACHFIFCKTVVGFEVLCLTRKLIYLVFKNLARESYVPICMHRNEIGM